MLAVMRTSLSADFNHVLFWQHQVTDAMSLDGVVVKLEVAFQYKAASSFMITIWGS